MADGQKRRMHTVPEGYLEAFAVHDPARRSAGIWRFDRTSGQSKMLGVGQSEVEKDFYTVFRDGNPDTGIEDIFCGIEGDFCKARNALLERTPLLKEHRTALARFIAAQLLRTPRFFQLMQDGLDAEGISYERDDLKGAMLVLIDRWIPRLARMSAVLAYNDTGLPLLTCDNPAVMWKKNGDSFICGVDQYDPELVISCPITPALAFVAYQTHESLQAVHAERHDIPRAERVPGTFVSHVDGGTLPELEVKRLNQICISNAHRYVYASYSDKPLLRFLQNRFFGSPAPVRSRDLQPIGSPVAIAKATRPLQCSGHFSGS